MWGQGHCLLGTETDLDRRGDVCQIGEGTLIGDGQSLGIDQCEHRKWFNHEIGIRKSDLYRGNMSEINDYDDESYYSYFQI